MLVEKNISDALKDYDKGKKVLVLTTMNDGTITCDKLENLFPEGAHFLVDVPAVQSMAQSRSAEPAKEEKAEDAETSTPPLARKRRV